MGEGPERPIVCTIGTTDPWNAAGVGLDIRALEENGARAVVVVAGVSAQDARGIAALHALPPETIAAQFAALRDAPIGAYRVGALPGASIAAVASALRGIGAPLVYDPVISATLGGRFVTDAEVGAIVAELIPLATIVTPNCDEARILTGLERCNELGTMTEAAHALVTLGAHSALVTGGRLAGRAFDVFFDGEREVFEHPAVAAAMRGTGCLLAAALAAGLARGAKVRDAIAAARAYVRRKLESARELGGMRVADF